MTKDIFIWPRRNTWPRNILIWPGPKWRPHKRIEFEQIREAWREIWIQFTERKKQEKRLKILEILGNILMYKQKN